MLWFKDQNLIVNVSKTKWVLFSKNKNTDTSKLFCNGKEVERVETFVYLGVTLDSNLNYKCHTEKVKGKVALAIGLIERMKRNINVRMFSLLLNAYVFSVIDYCFIIWGYENTELILLQRRINRLLCNFFQKVPKKKRKKVKFYARSHYTDTELFTWL